LISFSSFENKATKCYLKCVANSNLYLERKEKEKHCKKEKGTLKKLLLQLPLT